MSHSTRRIASWVASSACVAALVMPMAAMAQGATTTPAPETPPARETPRPQDIDPAVNTSSPSQTPRETPRPQDIDPAVNTSATPSPSAAAGTSGAPTATKPAAGAAAPGGTSSTAASSTPNRSGATGAARPQGRASDRIELDATQITGNRELPKVLYIVPWKRADLGDLVGKPVNSLLDEVLTPVDRDVFKRENRYYRALTPGETPPANANGTPSAAPAAGSSTSGATSSGSAAPASRDER